MTAESSAVKSFRSVGRPRDDEKRQAIIRAGWALFLAQGVEATSVEGIAAHAGVSKVTLYRHFPDKTALFEAAVRREMETIEAAQRVAASPDSAMPIGDRLRAFGLALMRFLTSAPAIDFYAVVAGELRRHETLARAFYDNGPGRTRQNLIRLIEDAVRRDELSCHDATYAADELFGLWQGFSYLRLCLGIDIEALRADAPGRVERGTAVFLRAYATPREPSAKRGRGAAMSG